MKTAYLDCFAGISGDMFLGALVGVGVPLEVLQQAASALDLGVELRVGAVDRSGISSVKVDVLAGGKPADGGPEHTHAHAEAGHTDGEAHSHAEAGHTHSHAHTQTKSGHSDETHWHSQAEAGHPPARHEHGPAKSHAHSHAEAHTHEPQKPHVHGRSLTAIRELIRGAALGEGVKRRALETFELLGRAEANIHNVPIEQIHFHEVGAVDAIADIVAGCAGVESLGQVRWFCSPVNVGGGMVECAHGTFPVPAPATADLLRGVPTYSAHVEKELVTPTGAALLAMLKPAFGPQPAMRVGAVGYGAGSRNPKGFPNVLRLSLGETAEREAGREAVVVLETALDDATPQLLAYVAEQALAQGALDCMLAPVVMKKGRPGTLVTVLAREADADALERLLLKETTTLGVRRRTEQRRCLDREHVTVATAYGPVRVKIGSLDGARMNAAAEYEDCREAAARSGAAFKDVQRAAMAAFAL